jgi:hypothetical protein
MSMYHHPPPNIFVTNGQIFMKIVMNIMSLGAIMQTTFTFQLYDSN